MATLSAYDPVNSPVGYADRSLYQMSLLLADCTAFQELGEFANQAAAHEKIFLGIGPRPWDDVQFTKDELDDLFCMAQIGPLQDESEDVFVADGGAVGTPQINGTWDVLVRRIARPSEVKTHGESLVWLWFFAQINALAHEILQKAKPDTFPCPEIRQIDFDDQPNFSKYSSQAGQGVYLWTKLRIQHGFSLSQGS